MPFDVAWTTFAAVSAVVLLGGLVKGIAGFGYAIASTALLATFLDPASAVTVMILPTLVANVSLLRELGRSGLRDCAERFWPFVAAALAGTLLGMALLGRIPEPVLALGLGVFTLGYVVGTQPYVALPGGSWIEERCFRPGVGVKVGLGLVSGVVFGATNVAVQVVAYLDNLSLDRGTFVGVLAMVLVGISGVRIGAAWVLGLYAAGSLLALSVVAAVPGVVGVHVGSRVRGFVPESYQTAGTLVLLAVIGARLVVAGSTGL